MRHTTISLQHDAVIICDTTVCLLAGCILPIGKIHTVVAPWDREDFARLCVSGEHEWLWGIYDWQWALKTVDHLYDSGTNQYSVLLWYWTWPLSVLVRLGFKFSQQLCSPPAVRPQEQMTNHIMKPHIGAPLRQRLLLHSAMANRRVALKLSSPVWVWEACTLYDYLLY